MCVLRVISNEDFYDGKSTVSLTLAVHIDKMMWGGCWGRRCCQKSCLGFLFGGPDRWGGCSKHTKDNESQGEGGLKIVWPEEAAEHPGRSPEERWRYYCTAPKRGLDWQEAFGHTNVKTHI